MKRLCLVAMVGVVGTAGLCRAEVEPEVVEAFTADGIALRMKRYPNPGGVPVIFQTGLTANHNAMDMPVDGYSVVKWFHERGYDVYATNFRGHGRDEYLSDGPAGCAWTMDDFIAYDVEAIISRVTEVSGQRPFWVGHSMGGTSVYGYLMGAVYQDVVVDQEWVRRGLFGWHLEDVRRPRIVGDDALVDGRHEALAGLVTISSPPRVGWENYVTWLNWPILLFKPDLFWSYNVIVDQLAHDTGAQILAATLECIPLEDVSGFLTSDIRNIPFVGDLLGTFLDWVFDEIGSTFLLVDVFPPDAVAPEIIDAYLADVVDATSARVTQQLMQGIRKRGFRAFDYHDAMHEPYRYGKNMSRIEIPILMVSGGMDKVANDGTIRRHAYVAVSSEDRTLLNLPRMGHGDIVVGYDAFAETWTPVESWISARSQ